MTYDLSRDYLSLCFHGPRVVTALAIGATGIKTWRDSACVIGSQIGIRPTLGRDPLHGGSR